MYKYNMSIEMLVNKFPQIKKIYDDDKEYYKDLPYVFYESVFTKYIVSIVNLKDNNMLLEIFNFIEDMLLNGDEEVNNLVDVAVIESLYYDENFNDIYKVIINFCGELTKNSFNKCISWYKSPFRAFIGFAE